MIPRMFRPVTIAVHLIFSGYGTWLPNDPRGSGSAEVRKPELDDLGEIHFGRKPEQPSRDELRAFHREAAGHLAFSTFWFDVEIRSAIGAGFGETVYRKGYTCWACAVCSNHAHLLVRTHRDDAVTMWDAFANDSRAAVIALRQHDPAHPLWSSRPYRVFLQTPDAVRGRVDYVRKNPLKEGLPAQLWPFVLPYDGWPEHRRKR
jgi:hypothetical protein